MTGAVVRNETRLWKPGQTIDVLFLDGDEPARKKVEAIANEWTKYANIQFRYGVAKRPRGPIQLGLIFNQGIQITFKGEGFNSQVGMTNLLGDQHTMRLGGLDKVADEGAWRRVVLHEFGHALGLQHEHQSPASGIRWNEQVVINYYKMTDGWSEAETRRNVLDAFQAGHTNYTQFDPKSIMTYAILPGFTTNGLTVGWNRDLSEMDKQFIAKLYPRTAGQRPRPPDGRRGRAVRRPLGQ